LSDPQIKTVRADARPLYVRAEEALSEFLSRLQPGDRLPPEPVLARQLGISRSTLREALRSFEDRGLIDRRQGRGTFITARHPVIESGLEVLESLDALAARRGLMPSTENLVIEEQPADKEFADRLGMPVGTPLTVVSRTKTTDGTPVAYMIDAVPTALVSVEEMIAGFHGSVLDFLLARGEPPLSYAQADILPLKAGKALADKLKIRPGIVLLLLAETLFTPNNEPVGYSRNYFVPEYLNFHVIRRINTVAR
jgi:GntR family transcriptional regulator